MEVRFERCFQGGGSDGKVPHSREPPLPHFGYNAGTYKGSGGARRRHIWPHHNSSELRYLLGRCIRNELLNERFNRRSKLGSLNGAISKMRSLILLNINIMGQILGTKKDFGCIQHEKAQAWETGAPDDTLKLSNMTTLNSLNISMNAPVFGRCCCVSRWNSAKKPSVVRKNPLGKRPATLVKQPADEFGRAIFTMVRKPQFKGSWADVAASSGSRVH